MKEVFDYIDKCAESRREEERSKIKNLHNWTFPSDACALAFDSYQVHGDVIQGVQKYMSENENVPQREISKLEKLISLVECERQRLRVQFPSIQNHPFYRPTD